MKELGDVIRLAFLVFLSAIYFTWYFRLMGRLFQ